MYSRVSWGHATAQQLKRIPVDSVEEGPGGLGFILDSCELSRGLGFS